MTRTYRCIPAVSLVLCVILLLGLAAAPSAAPMPAPALHARPVQWRSGLWQPRAAEARRVQAAFADLHARQPDTHVVVQFERPVTPEQRAALTDGGLQLLAYAGSDTYFARLTPGLAAQKVAQVASATVVAPMDPAWKIQPALARAEFPDCAIVNPGSEGNLTVAVYVLLHRDEPLVATAEALAKSHGGEIKSLMTTVNGFVIELPADQIAHLTTVDAVQWVEAPLKFGEMNNDSRARTGADMVQAAPYGLDGTGIRVLVYDGGTIYPHPDFGSRLVIGDSAGNAVHATHVAGTVGGSGLQSSGLYRGMAPAVGIVSYAFQWNYTGIFLYTNPGDMEHDYTEAMKLHHVDLATNSIGTNIAKNGFDCDFTGDYGTTDTVIDAVVRGGLGRPLPVVWACGNERGQIRCRNVYQLGDYHSLPPPANAKNQIGIGALNSNDDSVTYFTSWGPTDDGRLKPDVAAPGCQTDDDEGVTSCSYTDGYATYCGTSMAAPAAAGLTALLLQDFRAQFPGRPDPRGSTVKILLAQNAADIGNVGPDYQSGFGSVRIQPTIDFMRTGYFLEDSVQHGQRKHMLVDVSGSAAPLVITLAWDDVPGTPNVIPSLVNDLDLVVYDPNGGQHFPWTLDPNHPDVPAVRTQADHLNNIEQVRVDAPMPGRWRVEVYGYNVPEGPQPFSVAAAPSLDRDCDEDGLPDAEEIAADPSLDCTGNGVLDICEPDCNGNGRADSCDIAAASSADCDNNGVPDDCQADCNGNGVADACDIRDGTSTDCDGDDVPDDCQDTSADCNSNGIWDACDVAHGTSTDMNHNGIPDECETAAALIYVENGAGYGSGTLSDPYRKIAYALQAALPGSLVIVRDGTYSGLDNRDLNFEGKDFVLKSENGPANCIIDCGNAARAFIFTGGETAAARVEGFTITRGYDYMHGGAVWCAHSAPTFINCVFRENRAYGFMNSGLGGAMAIEWEEADTALIGCTFEGNTAGQGGALCVSAGANVLADRCVFKENSAATAGGALMSYKPSTSLLVRDSVIYNNVATSTRRGTGGAGYVLDGGSMTLEHCTVWANSASKTAGILAMNNGGNFVLSNTVCWDNINPTGGSIAMTRGDASTIPAGWITVRYTDLPGGIATVNLCSRDCYLDWGPGNIDVDPLFSDIEFGDFHMHLDSPCVDAGDPAFMPAVGETDIDGEPRVQNGRSDMGADETMADCNGNGVPDYEDIARGTACDDDADGIPDECQSSDLDLDGDVDIDDLNLLVQCMAGPGNPNPGVAAELFARADANNDDDVDLDEFNRMQRAFTGAARRWPEDPRGVNR